MFIVAWNKRNNTKAAPVTLITTFLPIEELDNQVIEIKVFKVSKYRLIIKKCQCIIIGKDTHYFAFTQMIYKKTLNIFHYRQYAIEFQYINHQTLNPNTIKTKKTKNVLLIQQNKVTLQIV